MIARSGTSKGGSRQGFLCGCVAQMLRPPARSTALGYKVTLEATPDPDGTLDHKAAAAA